MAEEKKQVQVEKDDLILVDDLIKSLVIPDWQKVAFLQAAGWKKGKSVTKKQFDLAYQNFIKKYGGTK